MERIIIAIECENFEKAKLAYRSWLRYLSDMEPECIEEFSNANLYVDIDRIFRYIFFDCHMESIFTSFSAQILYQDEFFFLEGVSQDYWKYERREYL